MRHDQGLTEYDKGKSSDTAHFDVICVTCCPEQNGREFNWKLKHLKWARYHVNDMGNSAVDPLLRN